MALMLSDMDNFTLAELDDFTLQELDSMSYAQLFAAVQEKYRVANERCDKDTPLSDEQIQVVTAIVHAYMAEHERREKEPLSKTLTIGIAINAIWAFLCFLTNTTIEYLPEITKALEQAYTLLEQLIQQAG